MKICSLLPSGTEILFALGLGEQIVGVSDLCDFPPEAAFKPVVSRSKVDPSVLSSEEVEAAMIDLLTRGENPYELDQEWLVRESPDVILTQDLCHVCEVDAGQVTGVVAGMAIQPRVVVLQPRTFEDILESFLQVGQVCGAEGAAKQAVAAMRQRVQAVQAKLPPPEARPRVFSLEGINPLVVGGHWIPGMLDLAGGKQDLLEAGCAAKRLEWAEVRAYDPDKLFVDLCSSDLARNLREAPWLEEQEGWREMAAVRNGEVYLIDHSYFSRPGPRVIEGLEILAQLTHPDSFSGLVPSDSVVKLDARLYAGRPSGGIADCFAPYA
ncbi:MAG: ABC transporter substrate-binding protein [Chloroflexi bacterium]|nr:ABC transporter substrate-binding protein [Chloroflexota bacterium]MDA1271079.1 ABC transporter substrate-binding protein [Chloroflexota bacterium]